MGDGAASAKLPASELVAAVAALRRDALVVYPTETFYGLGARALSRRAVGQVAALKGRERAKPIAVIISEPAMLDRIVERVPRLAEPLMARFWPGPLTLVLPARPNIPPELTAGSGAVGVRISSHRVARQLAAAVGEPITATSANPGGEPAASDVETARRFFGTRVDVYVDGGALAGGSGSTVLLVREDAVEVVRAGAVPVAALREVLGATPIGAAS